jgi:hypothetical protein
VLADWHRQQRWLTGAGRPGHALQVQQMLILQLDGPTSNSFSNSPQLREEWRVTEPRLRPVGSTAAAAAAAAAAASPLPAATWLRRVAAASASGPAAPLAGSRAAQPLRLRPAAAQVGGSCLAASSRRQARLMGLPSHEAHTMYVSETLCVPHSSHPNFLTSARCII